MVGYQLRDTQKYTVMWVGSRKSLLPLGSHKVYACICSCSMLALAKWGNKVTDILSAQQVLLAMVIC